MYNSDMSDRPNLAHMISQRRNHARRADKNASAHLRRSGIAALAVFSLALFVGIAVFDLYYASITTDLPGIAGLPDQFGETGILRQATRLYDRSGEQLLVTIENPNSRSARYLYLELIPAEVVNATLAARDPDFWTHPGFQRESEMPSLAEQLVSDLLLWQEPESLQRTWRTRLLAAQITKTYGRETVLEWYLNNASYGQLAFGIDEAAWVYFSKPAEELNLAEAALLASCVDAPALNPIDAPQLARDRQSQILSKMVSLGLVTDSQGMTANAQPILLLTTALPLEMTAPDFTRLALETLYAEIGKDRVDRGGFEITTTVDLALQTQTACTLKVQLGRLDGSLPTDTLTDRNCGSAALLPRLNRDELLPEQTLEASIVIQDPVSGEILALAGDASKTHQTGTVIAPFIYLTAFTRGMGPASLVWDVPSSLPAGLDGYQNFDGSFHGPMRVRTAAAFDHLVPLLATVQQIGPANAWRTVQQSGISSSAVSPENNFSPLLDEGRAALTEVTQAYSMLANQGQLAGAAQESRDPTLGQDVFSPILILQVVDGNGREWAVQTPETRSVTTPQLAYLVNDMLRDDTVRRESLGYPNAFEIGRPVAAKQGRGLTESSIWTVGYTPDRVVSVWIGLDGNGEEAIPYAAASGIWHALMKTASQELTLRDWKEPIGIVQRVVCVPSGLLPTTDCPQTATEIFITGNEPLQSDNLYRSFVVNTQTGRLATIYTPEDLLDERVYLVVPPEAAAWALQEGLDIPPDTYDVVFNPGTPSESAQIVSPEIFSYVSGTVTVTGTAGGENFDFYRVRIGEGLNPRQWLQIGEAVDQPVELDALVEWDTSGLNGLYALQLQVITANQSIETASIQVTVDNQAPSVQVIRPLEDAVFAYPEEKDLTFQALVSDNLGVLRVEFWVDGKLISLISDPPYTVPWSGTSGEHQLEVRAIDLAENITITVVPFEFET